jgi:hypothetical protein
MSKSSSLIEELYRERYVGFRNALAPVVGSREAAHDIVQEAFTRALRVRRLHGCVRRHRRPNRVEHRRSNAGWARVPRLHPEQGHLPYGHEDQIPVLLLW